MHRALRPYRPENVHFGRPQSTSKGVDDGTRNSGNRVACYPGKSARSAALQPTCPRGLDEAVPPRLQGRHRSMRCFWRREGSVQEADTSALPARGAAGLSGGRGITRADQLLVVPGVPLPRSERSLCKRNQPHVERHEHPREKLFDPKEPGRGQRLSGDCFGWVRPAGIPR